VVKTNRLHHSRKWLEKFLEKRQKIIEKLAYLKWEEAGRPGGRSEEFWTEAEKEFERIWYGT
jgi:hypothetical protein